MTQTLQQVLTEELGRKFIERTAIPATITANLNPAFTVRPYQERAFRYFLNYWEESFDGKPRQNHQLLFHMATGSGKTMMMAGLILHLYAKGYRNFLFFVNSTNIIDKTRDNFLNPLSPKYLFSEEVSFGEKRVAIKEVENFQAESEDINIAFSTIQGLHRSLNNPRENSLTYEDFEDKRIVLISDEAHHINAETKKGAELSQEELFESVSWEGTVKRIFTADPGNVLLEFTATVDFSDEALAAKYKPKLIFDYPLKDFRKDGYSKEVKVLQADLPQFQRALQAVVLSQYRRKIFEKNGLTIKPVLLFKSKTIKESQEFFAEFKEGMRTLKAASLSALNSATADPVVKQAYAYFNGNAITMSNLVMELQEDFAPERLISVNSKEESYVKQLAVNSLETNDYRAVFAVDKLNEGWDVLNLFDIVRLYDTRDSKAGKIGKTTMSEAQLIGRGARYCPFQVATDQPLYGRKYDSDLDNELRVCEELYYHSAYNPKYIQELNTALQEIGLKPKVTRERKVSLKKEFKATDLYKAGHIFLNERVRYAREDIDGLDSSLINQTYRVQLATGYTRSSLAFEIGEKDAGAERKTKEYTLSSFGSQIIRTALQRLEFYEFSNLKKYLPKLKSIHEFISSEKYLARVKLEVSGNKDHVVNLSPDDQLHAATLILSQVAEVIASDKVEYKGTADFKPFMVKDTFTDKTLNFMEDDGGDQEFGRSMNDPAETAYHLDLSKRAWFAFDDCFGTSEEKLLIHYIDKKYDELSTRFAEAFLLRNEKHFKLYAFKDGRPLEPDFVLYLVGKEKKDTMHYQVFIEPKGKHLLEADKWKEEFLLAIQSTGKVEKLFANRDYALWGMPFFNSEVRMPEFENGFAALTKTL